LDPKLQDGKKIPKWQPRARRGQFLGYSKDHLTTIGLVLNIATGHVSPQFHVVYDDLLTSVPNAEHGGLLEITEFEANARERLVDSGLERSLDDGNGDRLPPLHDSWLSPAKRNLRILTRHCRQTAQRECNEDRQRNVQRGEEEEPRRNRPVVSAQNHPIPDDNDNENPTNENEDKPPDLMESDDDSDSQSLVDDRSIPPDQRNDAETPPVITTRSGWII
jgi:hypothetical protein